MTGRGFGTILQDAHFSEVAHAMQGPGWQRVGLPGSVGFAGFGDREGRVSLFTPTGRIRGQGSSGWCRGERITGAVTVTAAFYYAPLHCQKARTL